MITKYNKGYDITIEWDEEHLPKLYYKGIELVPYLKRSNTRLQYPIVNVPNHGQNYVHLIVAYSYLDYNDKLKLKSLNKGRVVVDHINGNTFDYRPSNLRYLLNRDNTMKHDGYMEVVE